MNKADRKQIQEIFDILSEQKERLEQLQGEIQEKADNIEEHFPNSEKAEKLQEESNSIQEYVDDLETVADGLAELIGDNL